MSSDDTAASWAQGRREAALELERRLNERKAAESAKAQAMIDAFLADAPTSATDPEPLVVQGYRGGRARTTLQGWYLKADRSVALGTDGGFYVLRADLSLRERLRGLGVPRVQARTFHSAALRQLQYFWPQAVGGPPPGLVNHKARLLTEAAQAMRLTTDRATVRNVAGEVEWAKVSMLTPDTYAAAAEKRSMPMGYDVRTMQRLYQSYEDLKADRHLIDFEDVLLITVGIL